MSDFIRARSPEQKEQRIAEIKEAADSLFRTRPYNEITLSTIAEQLSWTRANLYRYVSTKEEIYLQIAEGCMRSYYDALDSAVPAGCGYTPETLADVWAGIMNAHQDYFRYATMLQSIIETNVSVERLAPFKAEFVRLSDRFSARLVEIIGVSKEAADMIQLSVLFHGNGMVGYCFSSKLVRDAMEMAGVTVYHALQAASYTSRNGTPFERAIAATSSYSG